MSPQASDSAKEAEDNARKAKSTVKTVLKLISTLMEQLGEFPPEPASSGLRPRPLTAFVSAGNMDKVDLSRLTQIDESLKRAKDKMEDSDLDRKLAELQDVARSQEDMINDYDRQIRDIRADIANLNDIKNTLPDGCFNTPSLEQP